MEQKKCWVVYEGDFGPLAVFSEKADADRYYDAIEDDPLYCLLTMEECDLDPSGPPPKRTRETLTMSGHGVVGGHSIARESVRLAKELGADVTTTVVPATVEEPEEVIVEWSGQRHLRAKRGILYRCEANKPTVGVGFSDDNLQNFVRWMVKGFLE